MIRFDTTMGQVTIRFRHNLPSIEINRNNDLTAMVNNLKIKQGTTECLLEIVEKDNSIVEYFGLAHTHPSDQYKKEAGRVLSLQRAIEAGTFKDTEYREIMAGYYSR